MSNTINLALDSDCIFIVEKFISTITINENKERIKEIICKIAYNWQIALMVII